MPTQKTFKCRVRTRMAKTGEAYTAARAQLIRKGRGAAAQPTPSAPQPAEEASAVVPEPIEMPTTDDALRRATEHGWDEWFATLDAWGASDRRHAEIARWLTDERGVDGWWAQSITVGYERARGMRRKHELARGFGVSSTKTVGVVADAALAAFTNPRLRRAWLPDAPMRRRPTRATSVARFDWFDPPSRLVVSVDPIGPARTVVSVQHEQLPDAAAAERVKLDWRRRLVDLKATLERR